MEHRNSQKRFYGEGFTYFVTGVTKNRHPYFEEEIFCELFKCKLELCSRLKQFQLHGWFLGFDHFHLLVTPMGDANISEIIQFLKRHVSRNINEIMNFEGDIGQCRLQKGPYSKIQSKINAKHRKLKSLQQKFQQKHPTSELSFPKFQWQKSFHDHVIRNQRDYENHLKYIEYNLIKHNVPEGWKWFGFN